MHVIQVDCNRPTLLGVDVGEQPLQLPRICQAMSIELGAVLYLPLRKEAIILVLAEEDELPLRDILGCRRECVKSVVNDSPVSSS